MNVTLLITGRSVAEHEIFWKDLFGGRTASINNVMKSLAGGSVERTLGQSHTETEEGLLKTTLKSLVR